MADEKPIVIIKKKGGHGGHHGGAWKIAYADFVTAMMCFFLVMWLVNSAEVSTRQAIASYFRRPGLFSEGSGTPLLIGGAGILEDAYSPAKPTENKGSGKGLELKELAGTPVATPKVRTTPVQAPTPEPTKGSQSKSEGEQKGGAIGGSAGEANAAAEKAEFQNLAAAIKSEIAKSQDLAKLLGIVDVKVEADGLNIEIMDTAKTSMFRSGSATVQPEAREAFSKIADLIKGLPNKIDIVGHTDAKPFSSRIGGYSNWELSADRANAARKILDASGITPDRIASVVGRADKELRVTDGLDPSNRRITLKMRFNFTRKIDLSRDPKALENINSIEHEAPIAGMPVPSAEPETAETERETTHSIPVGKPTQAAAQGFRPKKIFKAKKSEVEKTVLPDEDSPASGNPSGASGVFDNSPVVTSDPFANF